MTKLIKLFPALLLFLSSACEKTTTGTETETTFHLSVAGPISLPSEGGIIKFELEAYTITDNGDVRGKEHTPVESVTLKYKNGLFNVSRYSVDGLVINVETEADPNTSGEMLSDNLIVTLTAGSESHTEVITVTQESSRVSYEKFIEYNGPKTIDLPAEGGTFEVGFKSLQKVYTDGNYTGTIPSDLKGLQMEITEVNCAALHSAQLQKAEQAGSYIIKYIAEGPYNLDVFWKGGEEYYVETKSLVKIVNPEDNSDVLVLEFIHPQTPGEEYYYGPSSFYSRVSIEI